MRVLVTGGAGFIGSALVRHLIENSAHDVLNFDKLTYAGTLTAIADIAHNPRYRFVKGDVCDPAVVADTLASFQPDAITHLAAESHVDRSIDAPDAFIQTNLGGTYVMLTAAHAYWRHLSSDKREGFRFHHISTDEVYGSLGHDGLFTEDTAYDPRSPYSASKAGSDHLVSAWGHTYGLPVLITNCSNNYGPFHFPEKLIPLMIVKALAGGWTLVRTTACWKPRNSFAPSSVGKAFRSPVWRRSPTAWDSSTVRRQKDEGDYSVRPLTAVLSWTFSTKLDPTVRRGRTTRPA